MKTDAVIRLEAMDALIEKLGEVDAERFIAMVNREKFDYTKWQRNLWQDKTIDEIHKLATEFENNKKT
jgi:hypothetical protein